jgi:Late exocytosis, associated with Golgi transport/Cytosolic domain of 10TM putative phosphate transporter
MKILKRDRPHFTPMIYTSQKSALVLATSIIIVLRNNMMTVVAFALSSKQLQRQTEEAEVEEEESSSDGSDDDLFSWSDYAEESYYSSYASNNGNSFWNNFTQSFTETDPNFDAAKDVSVDAVVASLYFNALAFVGLMIFYELLRHFLPAVYSSKKRLDVIHHTASTNGNDPTTPNVVDGTSAAVASTDNDTDELNLPDERPLDWIRPVLGVPWQKVREMVGLDGYFFLRYIRMNVRITAISTFWLFLIVVPVYFYGGNEASNLTSGWYRISAANLSAQSNLMWVPCIALYFFTGFIFFVIQQEYEHYFNVRQDFLAKGSTHVHPQHHYSVVVENIPDVYQSDVALAKYFESLFPDSVHSAVVVLNVPDLIDSSNKCMRTCRRLEKSIAYWHATGRRPTHIVGRARMRLLGIIDMQPLNCPATAFPDCNGDSDSDDDDDHHHPATSSKSVYTHMTDDSPAAANAIDDGATTDDKQQSPKTQQAAPAIYESRRPPRGTRVDSISYYTQELAAHSRTLFRMQQRKIKIANDGAEQLHNEHLVRMKAIACAENGGNDTDLLHSVFWLDQIFLEATHVVDQILDDSEWDNALTTPPTYDEIYDPTAKAIPSTITTKSTNTSLPVDYGSMSPTNSNLSNDNNNRRVRLMREQDDGRNLCTIPGMKPKPQLHYDEGIENSDYFHAAAPQQNHAAPFTTDQYSTWLRRWLGRLGLDFVVFVLRYITKQWDVSCLSRCAGSKDRSAGIRSDVNIMSRTGFVTFLDLASTTTAASAPLNSNRSTINGGPVEVTLAPEPRVSPINCTR